MIYSYCLTRFIHLSVLLDFGAPNPSRHHKSCSQSLGGGLPGDLPLALEEQRLQHRRVGMAEARLRRPRYLLEVSEAGKSGC